MRIEPSACLHTRLYVLRYGGAFLFDLPFPWMTKGKLYSSIDGHSLILKVHTEIDSNCDFIPNCQDHKRDRREQKCSFHTCLNFLLTNLSELSFLAAANHWCTTVGLDSNHAAGSCEWAKEVDAEAWVKAAKYIASFPFISRAQLSKKIHTYKQVTLGICQTSSPVHALPLLAPPWFMLASFCV